MVHRTSHLPKMERLDRTSRPPKTDEDHNDHANATRPVITPARIARVQTKALAQLRLHALSAQSDPTGAYVQSKNNLANKLASIRGSATLAATALHHGPIPAIGVISKDIRRSSSSSSSSSSSNDSGPSANSPFVACTTTQPKHLICRIRLGKIVKFDKLLPVHDDLVFGGLERQGTVTKRQRPTRRQVHNLASWLEAWNIFLACTCPVSSSGGPPTGEIPGHNVPSVSAYQAVACLKYDSFF